MKKQKVVIVAGPPLAGKTKYIQDHYSHAPGYYHFDFAKEYKAIMGGLDNFPELDNAIAVYNSLMDKLAEALLLGKKDLVFEYCTGSAEMDQALVKLIHLIEVSDTEVAMVQLSAEMETVMQREQANMLDPDHVASLFTNEPTIEILSAFFEDL